jgi:hypothetical protein
MPRKDVVSWTPLVGALHRFAEMRASGVPCDSHACVGEHHAIIKRALVDM